jgi:glycosyltransferase involved in cell wall biosynthesis
MRNSYSGKDPDERAKVFFFVPSLAGGGAERVMVDMLRYIDKRKIEPVLLLLYPYEDSPYREDLPDDIDVIVVGRKSDSLFDKIRQIAAFLKTVFEEKPQLILSMLTHANIMAILSGMLFKKRVIVCEHNTLGKVVRTKEGKNILGFPVSPMVKILYRYAGRIITVSNGIRENLIEEFHSPSDKIKIIYNPVDMPRIAKLSEAQPEHPFLRSSVPVIISIGRLVPQKGFDILIKAFGRVVSETDARLIIMGEGPERGPLEKITGDLGLSDRVSFIGFQHNPYAFLARADLYVLSSRYEGLPVSLLEAMACGVPVIAADCQSGPCEILRNGEHGILVPVGDVEGLSEAILRLLRNRELRETLSKSGMQRINDFSAEKVVKEYEDTINSLL